MSGNRLDLIEKAIDGIDRKYIDQTAETIFKKAGTATELTEIRINVHEKTKREKISDFFRAAVPIAAAAALVIGLGVWLGGDPLGVEQPSETTSSTSVPEVSSGATSAATVPDTTTSAGTGSQEVLPLDSSKAEINVSTLKFSESFDFETFEKLFYNKWTIVKSRDNFDLAVLNLMYYGVNNYEPWASYTGNIAETSAGTIMEGVNGGKKVYLFIPKDDTAHLYLYSDLKSPTFKLSDYKAVYERSIKQSALFSGRYNPNSLESGLQSLTLAGLRKLNNLTGFEIPEGELTDNNGKKWVRKGNKTFGYGRFFLKSRDENQICWSARFVPAGVDLDKYKSDDIEDIGFRYLSVTSEKINGKWSVTDVSEFDTQLEKPEDEPIGDGLYHAKWELEQMNSEITDNKKKMTYSIAVKYIPLANGHYYALRYIGFSNSKDYKYVELFYNNGTEYSQVHSTVFEEYTNTNNNFPYAIVGDMLFFYGTYYENGDTFVLAAKEEFLYSFTEESTALISQSNAPRYDVAFDSSDIYKNTLKTLSAQRIGDFIAIRARSFRSEGYIEKVFIFHASPLHYGFMPLREVKLDEDGKGFTAKLDRTIYHNGGGNDLKTDTVRYRPDSGELNDVLWALDTENSIVWSHTAATYFRTEEALTVGLYGYEYICDRSELFNSLKRTYTDDEAINILNSNYLTSDGRLYSIYCSAELNGEIGDITCEIEKQSDYSAVIRYTAYKWDSENNRVSSTVYDTYTVNAIKTENGWRLDRFYSVRDNFGGWRNPRDGYVATAEDIEWLKEYNKEYRNGF